MRHSNIFKKPQLFSKIFIILNISIQTTQQVGRQGAII